jgi:hypothetical protein
MMPSTKYPTLKTQALKLMSQAPVAMSPVVSDCSFTAAQKLFFFSSFFQAYTPKLGLASSFYKHLEVLDLGPNLVRIRQPKGIKHISH